MSTMEALEALKDHLKNHLSDLLQTHESYQIQWESRLDNAVGRSRNKNLNCHCLLRFPDDGAKNRDL